VVLNLGKIFEDALSTAWFKLQQIRIKVFSEIKSFIAVVNLEDESNESQKTLYLFSLMLLISVVFLSPDRLGQALSPIQMENGLFERIEETARIVKRLVSYMIHL
jgi:hypothetical protein